jgi:hypothetical protein
MSENDLFSFVNAAPTGEDNTATTLEDTPCVFVTSDFGVSDAADSPANAFYMVQIISLPTVGTLTYDGNAVSTNDLIPVWDIADEKLVFTPDPDGNGTGYASFNFKVMDDGSTWNGGANLDTTARTMTIDVTAVNSASITGRIWSDTDNDGVQDSGEGGMAYRTVSLYNANDELIATYETASDGVYIFSNLAAGQYYLRFEVGPEELWSTPNAGSDDTIDSDVSPNWHPGEYPDGDAYTQLFTLGDDEELEHIDAGNHFLGFPG